MTIQSQLEQIAAAFDRHDYAAAAKLLNALKQVAPEHPWVQLYIAHLYAVSGKAEPADVIYRKLLQQTTNPKLALQARQGLQRLEDTVQQRRQEAIAQAIANPYQTGLGFLILEPMTSEAKQAAIQKFARLMKLDPYTARIHLSHRGWKLYRTGAIGELQVYGQELRDVGIPAFWVSLAEIQTVAVFRVQAVQSLSSKGSVLCLSDTDQIGTLSFDWSEVRCWVEGSLPIFENVIDLGAWNQLKWTEKTQDYAQLLDLHLPKRNCILRFCDITYQFQQGIPLDKASQQGSRLTQTTNRIRWNHLLQAMHQQLPGIPTWIDFIPFAETALDHLDLSGTFQSHIDLFRKQETVWDQAFQLYSTLIFINNSPTSRD